jgi:mono/diheme cytochrome c family protein
MKQMLILLFGLLFAAIATQCVQIEAGNESLTDTQAVKLDSTARVKRGEYLVTISGCNDCHSPKIMTPQGPVPDPKRLLSGHSAAEPLPAITDKKMIAPGQWALFSSGLTAAVGPWGTSFAANLTPDDTGIGNWTEAQFFKAIREGKSKGLDGTRPMLPPMPWFNFAKMSDEDLKAVFAYLKSIPPVQNAVPNPIPPSL